MQAPIDLRELRRSARHAAGLRRFLRAPLTLADARALVREGLATRGATLVDVLDRAVYRNSASPYRRLLEWAGIELGDVRVLVREHGVEGALERLFDAGVYVRLEEFKGRRAIERPGLTLEPRTADFDNPLITPDFYSRTGGSRGPGRRVMMSFDGMIRDASYEALFLDAFAAGGRPLALWRPVPPGRAGLNHTLHIAKLGGRVERWFSQNELSLRQDRLKEFLFTRFTLLGAAWWARGIPLPEHVPLGQAERVARWLAEKRSAGPAAVLNAPASSGVRVCLAAREHDLDISGTLFRFGGEPLTRAKADAVTATGSRVVCNYSMSEIGRVGVACAAGRELDDVHVVTDRLGVVQRERDVGVGSVDALHYTTLQPDARLIMLNVESDDYGVLESRECGCAFGALGLKLHVHGIRSYEKLTSEGMNFVGSELISLVEEVLPARFGGKPTDYQLAEEEVDGVPKVSLLVSPGVGPVDEHALASTVLDALGSRSADRAMMTEIWRQGETFRVVRREPYATPAAKILPLHVVRGPEGASRSRAPSAGSNDPPY